jgi:D-beta-D-heptose 7-phosphate kinase/D-beta-D-heptose 1-phosphate adenosyltransferase
MAVWTKTEISSQIQKWQAQGLKVVFTNGCFDIIHTGHTTLLEMAAQEGDRLIVGLNSDNSVRRLKGSTRPVNPESKRAALLDELKCVTGVVVFEEDTPLELIRELNPDVLVKGGDYSEETIVGAQDVKTRGGRIVIIPLVEGFSTTNILADSSREKA